MKVMVQTFHEYKLPRGLLVMLLLVKNKRTLYEQLQTMYRILYATLSNNHSIILSFYSM